MPIDQFLLEPMISPYENMIKDVESKGLTGEDVNALKAAFARIKELGQEHSDIGAFAGACMQENLYTTLSDHYSKALSSAAGSGQAGDPQDYDDSALLKQSVEALKMAIEEIKKSKEEALIEAAKDPKANLKAESEFASRFAKQYGLDVSTSHIETSQNKAIDEEIAAKPNAFDNTAEVEALDMSADIIPPIQDLIALGEEAGMTLPKFLRLQIEKGLDKATEGGIATRKGLVYSKDWAEASAISPHHIAEANEDIEVFDDLASKQKFGVPNWKELRWAHTEVEYKYELDKIKWGEITDRWESILSDLSLWALAHCSFAPYVDPWKMLDLPKRPPAIKRDKYTLPGIIKEKERLLEKYFGIKFMDIFEHPTFKWAVEKSHIGYSKEYVEFLKSQVYPNCVPCELLPSEVVQHKEKLYNDKKEIDPHAHYPQLRIQKHYDAKFGEGRYVSKFGNITAPDTNAEPW